jgi:hypothetical protein
MADLDPAALRSANGEKKKWTETESLETCVPYEVIPLKRVLETPKMTAQDGLPSKDI